MAVKTSPYFSKQCNGIEVHARKRKKERKKSTRRGREEEEEERETGVTGMELHTNVSSGGNIKETQRWSCTPLLTNTPTKPR